MKKSVHTSLLFIVVLIISIGQCLAQSKPSHKEYVQVYFRQSDTKIDLLYRNNEVSLRRFVDAVNEYRCDSTANIGRVRILASVSPEGSDAVNERILKERASSVVNWINQYIFEPVDRVVDYGGIDRDILVKLVEEHKESRCLPYRNEVLDILRNEYVADKPLGYNGCFEKLSRLHDGESYMWLRKYLFPELRCVTAELTISFDVVENKVPDAVTTDISTSGETTIAKSVETPGNGENVETETTAIINTSIEQIERDSTRSEEKAAPPPLRSKGKSVGLVEVGSNAFCVALKTNVLYLLAAVPNLGAEVYMGGGWSLAANWQYAWWSNDAACWYHRIYGGDVALRKWFGKRAASTPLSGHHIGIYGQMLTYDFIFGKDRIGQLADKWSYGGGVEYGYSVPVGKALRFDFTLGVGYLTGIYKTYELQDKCYVWQQTRKRNYIGPTKAEISLVWVIGGKKGGAK